MTSPKRKTSRRSRQVFITPKGYRILRAIERGTYKFSDKGRPGNCK